MELCYLSPNNCSFSASLSQTLLDSIKPVLPNILEQSDSFINNVLLFSDTCLDDSSNTVILNVTIVVLYVRLTEQYFIFFCKYYKCLKRKMKTPQLAFIGTNQLKYTNKNPKSNLYLYNMHK